MLIHFDIPCENKLQRAWACSLPPETMPKAQAGHALLVLRSTGIQARLPIVNQLQTLGPLGATLMAVELLVWRKLCAALAQGGQILSATTHCGNCGWMEAAAGPGCSSKRPRLPLPLMT